MDVYDTPSKANGSMVHFTLYTNLDYVLQSLRLVHFLDRIIRCSISFFLTISIHKSPAVDYGSYNIPLAIVVRHLNQHLICKLKENNLPPATHGLNEIQFLYGWRACHGKGTHADRRTPMSLLWLWIHHPSVTS